ACIKTPLPSAQPLFNGHRVKRNSAAKRIKKMNCRELRLWRGDQQDSASVAQRGAENDLAAVVIRCAGIGQHHRWGRDDDNAKHEAVEYADAREYSARACDQLDRPM